MGPLGGLFRLQLRDSIHGRLSRGLAGPVFVVVVLIILAILFTYIALRIANKEFMEKEEAGYKFVRGD